jgi:deoxyribodipyrimidine photolyase-related protein
MNDSRLILVLGDQLSLYNPALQAARVGTDIIVMAEVHEEANYVPHNRHKIALIFSAMRHFRDTLCDRGHIVHYYEYGQGLASLAKVLEAELATSNCARLVVCEPGEYRLRKSMEQWNTAHGVEVDILDDSRFLCSVHDFNTWADTQKGLRMEFFYRRMRSRYGLLLQESGKPCGDRWNYDSENRKGWRNQEDIPERPAIERDAITCEVLDLVEREFPDNPGDLARFNFAVTSKQAQAQLDWFCEQELANFGIYQDALAEESPWLFHSLVSMYLNIGLLEPLSVCRQVEQAWRDGKCDLAAAEGFIRQVLGWREYIRGVYWRLMPDYKDNNHFLAHRALPDWFWSGATDMRCLSRALTQSLDLGYGHHIQRLMVIGNFALLAGLDVEAVCEWFLAVYVDAFEWVELPNTLGMALHADGGIMASKPYAASGKYIQKQGNHCAQCRYSPSKTTGKDACPYNSLYWRFIDLHRDKLERNGRMGLILNNWKKRSESDQRAIIDWGERTLETVLTQNVARRSDPPIISSGS